MERTGPPADSRNTHRLVTERLIIEVPEPGDTAAVFDLVGGEFRAEVTETLVWDGPDSIADVEGWIDRCRSASYADWGYHWVIRDGSGDPSGTPGVVLGAVGTRPREAPGRGDVGYWLGRPYWGKGIMTEALGAVLGLGFRELGYAKIEADVFTMNERGLRLVEGLGMRREGTIRRALRKRGEWVDLAVYGMLAEEFE
jgi:RimJ/RimL family protein N-acetyltransferase